jgi:DNA polymerase III alpha subunit
MQKELSKGSHNSKDFVKARSFLAGNVDVLLESLSVKRESKKNNSEDLFDLMGASNEVKDSINWNTEYEVLPEFDLLLSEKESLGIYVSGNPLEKYLPILDLVKSLTYRDDLFLVLIEKAKKIFTRNNAMMFALQVTTPEDKYEGIIFPKNALDLSPVIEEKELFWVRGNIIQKRKKETATSDESQNSEEQSESEMPEYEELPKIAIDKLNKFEKGVLGLYQNDDIGLTTQRREMLEALDWYQLKADPGSLDTSNLEGKQTKNENSSMGQRIVRIPKSFGMAKLKHFKQRLKNQEIPGFLKIKIDLESGDGWKRVKGDFWVNPKDLEEFELE